MISTSRWCRHESGKTCRLSSHSVAEKGVQDNGGFKMSGPLDGVRVIDLTTIYSGPIATSILGDHGADVVKIEAPGGEAMRPGFRHQRNGVSGPFAMMNRNKRS
ncbi:MAG TPA: hypothetical protein DIT73_06635, partial [Gammaproteobacteria bacterium]|nr:hypothetical protein [Gammaproteobacteria bacterium]